MYKILITGNAGSGKTTLGHQLANVLNRKDLIFLDRVVWQPGWKMVNREERELQFAKIINQQTWIIDGVSKSILEAADTIIFLDYPRHICYWRAFKRNYKYLFHSRPELPEKCPEILVIGKLIKMIWNFPKVVKPALLSYMKENYQKKLIFHVTNNDELKSVIHKLS